MYASDSILDGGRDAADGVALAELSARADLAECRHVEELKCFGFQRREQGSVTWF